MPVDNIVIAQKVSRDLRERSKELRRNMTPAEKILWEKVRHNRLNGLQFRRQQISYDAERDTYLTSRGFQILRFANEEVTGNLKTVLQKISTACS